MADLLWQSRVATRAAPYMARETCDEGGEGAASVADDLLRMFLVKMGVTFPGTQIVVVEGWNILPVNAMVTLAGLRSIVGGQNVVAMNVGPTAQSFLRTAAGTPGNGLCGQ